MRVGSHAIGAVVAIALALACAAPMHAVHATARRNDSRLAAVELGASEESVRSELAGAPIVAPWGPYDGRDQLTNPWDEHRWQSTAGEALSVAIYYVRVAYNDLGRRCRSVVVELRPVAFSGGVVVATTWAELERRLGRAVPERAKVWGFIPKCA